MDCAHLPFVSGRNHLKQNAPPDLLLSPKFIRLLTASLNNPQVRGERERGADDVRGQERYGAAGLAQRTGAERPGVPLRVPRHLRLHRLRLGQHATVTRVLPSVQSRVVSR